MSQACHGLGPVADQLPSELDGAAAGFHWPRRMRDTV
jgi:hypothetical protein